MYDGQYRLVAESEIMAAKCLDEKLHIRNKSFIHSVRGPVANDQMPNTKLVSSLLGVISIQNMAKHHLHVLWWQWHFQISHQGGLVTRSQPRYFLTADTITFITHCDYSYHTPLGWGEGCMVLTLITSFNEKETYNKLKLTLTLLFIHPNRTLLWEGIMEDNKYLPWKE